MVGVTVVALVSHAAPAQRLGSIDSTHRLPGGVPPSPLARAARRNGVIRLDGRLDEPAWRQVPPLSGFTQSYPTPGARPVDSIEARVLYDESALYIGVRLYDSHPDSIAAQLSRRDAVDIYSDWATIFVDSYLDRRSAFSFGVNPLGVKRDAFISNDGDEDLNWDAVWDVSARVDSAGWVAEFRIPMSQLRFQSKAAEGRMWGFQIMRDVARRKERDSWSPWTPASGGLVSRFGELTGLSDVPPARGLELLPYASARVTRAPGDPANPFYRPSAVRLSGGLDSKYRAPASLTLTTTLNPDFGQVEVDPSVVNLTAFETLFPEKRPFFLEGVDALTFGRVVIDNDVSTPRFFYSRRIGRPPQRDGGGPDVAFVDRPDQTTIAGAAKVTGKSGPWTVGLLDAVTPEARARIVTSAGERGTTPVEPLTNYFVGRVKRDFRSGETFVGAVLTSTQRRESDSVFTTLLRSRATFGGVDFEHDIHQREYVVSGYVGASEVAGSTSAIASTQLGSTHYYQRPDASYLRYDSSRTSLGGHIGEVAIKKNGPWYGSVGYKEESPGLELNDLGFQGRADFRAFTTLVGYQSFSAGRRLRSYGAYGFTDNMWDFGGNSVFVRWTAGWTATLTNLSSVTGQLTRYPRYFNNQLTRGGPLALQPSAWNGSISASTDSRAIVALSSGGSYTVDETGGRTATASATLDYRPTSFIHFVMGPSLTRVYGTGQYVRTVVDANATSTFGARYVFASLHQTTISLDTRADWTFAPALTLQFFAQPFVSAGRFDGYKEFVVPATYSFATYGVDRGTVTRGGPTIFVDPDGAGSSPAFQFANPDFNVRSLRGNAVLRWEYRPGSALFLIWQQQRNDGSVVGDFSGRRDVGAIFRTVPTNVFLVKATYWMGQ